MHHLHLLNHGVFLFAANSWNIINPAHQFSAGLILIGFSLLILPLGIYFSNTDQLVNFNWIIASFTLQGISELMVAPIVS